MKVKRTFTFTSILLCYTLFITGIYVMNVLKEFVQQDSGPTFVGRHILQQTNCTPRSVEEFPPDFMTRNEKQDGGVLFHIIVSIYLFMALTVICDVYFVSSLNRICEVLHLKRDVAGATFMAAGSSAPELFTSVIGVFITKSDVGVSTIVGSAVFNVLFTVALCGMLSGMVIYLSWWPLFRDCIVYCLSVIALIAIISDGEVFWYEAVIFLIMYALYILMLYQNDRLHQFIVKILPFSSSTLSPNTEYTSLLANKDDAAFTLVNSSDDEEIMETGDVDSKLSKFMVDEDMTTVEGDYESVFEIPESFLQRLYWVTILPVNVICYCTIPDCRRPGCWRRLYLVTFLASVLWIAVVSYVLVWMVCIIGDTLDIPDTIMGLTLLAAGTSVPDAISSIIVAKDGDGDMAISNSIGSNIFDILLCLGLPWFIRTVIMAPGSVIHVTSSGMMFTAIILLSTVLLLLLSMTLNKWRLTKFLGLLFFVFYIIIILFACLYELNIFGQFSLPPCSRKYVI